MAAQVVAEGDGNAPVFAGDIDHMHVMGAWPAFDEVVPARYALLAPVLVAKLLHWCNAAKRLLVAPHADLNINDRLGGEAGHRCAADMLDVEDVWDYGRTNARGLL